MTIQDRLVATSFKGPGFDHIRLVAAIIVLLHHCRGIQHPDIRNDMLFSYSQGYMDFGRFAVVIFFIISGFLVTPGLVRTGSVIEYAIHRIIRIFPGLIVNILVTMLLLGPLLTVIPLKAYFSDPNLYLYAKNILTLTVRNLPGVVAYDGSPVIVNGALWTLHFEVLCYIALALASVLRLLGNRILFLLLWGAFYAAYIAIGFDPKSLSQLSDRFLIFASLFVYFASGVIIYLYRQYIPVNWVLAAAACGIMMVALPLGAGPVVMPICLPYLTVYCGLSALPGKVLLKNDLSYGVYLIHAPILVVFVWLFPEMHTWWIGAMVVLLVSLVLAYLSWAFVERPALNRKRRFSEWAVRCLKWRWQFRGANSLGRPTTDGEIPRAS